MGHEALMYGVILGATGSGDNFTLLHDLNAQVLQSLPEDDDHPWVDRSIFALPGAYPQGRYRQQPIHFGLSIKDEPYDQDGFLETWLMKFENVLRQLYWFSTKLHIDRDFGNCEIQSTASEHARQGLRADPPQPVTSWTREQRTS